MHRLPAERGDGRSVVTGAASSPGWTGPATRSSARASRRSADVMEVFRPGRSSEPGEVKGKIRVSSFVGIDASMGRLIQGKNPDVDDILKLAKREGI